MIRSPAIFFTILAYWLSGSVVMGSKNDDVAKNILFIWRMKFWFLVRRWMILIISTKSRIYTIFHPYTSNSFLAKKYYTTERSWCCVINNRTRFVVFIKRKFKRRRLHCYTQIVSRLLTLYRIVCRLRI